jgi:hypothetical protein
MNAPALLDKKPRGAFRRKYCDPILLIIIPLALFNSQSRPLDGVLLTLYCAVAAGVGATDIRAMWAVKARRLRHWVALLLAILGAGAVVGLLILDDMGIFTWNRLYLVIPAELYLVLTSAGAWFTEWRKPVLIYSGLEGVAFVRPPAPPLGRAQRYGLIALALIVSWTAFAFFHDETLDEGFRDFYFGGRSTIRDDENVSIGISGLAAPSGADFMEHGRFASGIWRSGGFSDEARTRINARGKLDFVGGREELQCWYEPLAKSKDNNCASEDRLVSLLEGNEELLSRYRQLYRLQHSSGLAYNLSLAIDLNRLIAAGIRLDLRKGRTESAYLKWRDNHMFLRRMIGEDGTWVDKAIGLVLEQISLSTAEFLIQASPKTANAHYQEMRESLSPGGLTRYNLGGVMRAEYLLHDPIYSNPASLKAWVHPGFIRNRFFRAAQDFLKASQGSPSDAAKDVEAVWNAQTSGWRWDYLRDPLNTVWIRVLLGGQMKTGSMLQQMHLHDGQMRLLTLRLDILHLGIQDSRIEAFLESAETGLRNPFTGEPMKWDLVKRAIYFQSPGEEIVTREVRL